MPWDETFYPACMRNLTPVERAKAIDIANALLVEGVEEGRAIQIAITKARQWSLRRSKPTTAPRRRHERE
jgi:uncharacterized protein YdaT